ncbi:hypothetical protein B7440_20470 [Escherichia coli]|nr:hypothetical protein B7440_20470 [Escherichia coli]
MLTVNTHGFATGDDFHSGIPLKTEDKSENRCDVVVTVRVKADHIRQRRKPGCHRLSDGPVPGYPPGPVPVPDVP